MSDLDLIAEADGGTLYEANGFLMPVLTGSAKDMGRHYGSLMVEHMQKVHDVLARRPAASVTPRRGWCNGTGPPDETRQRA